MKNIFNKEDMLGQRVHTPRDNGYITAVRTNKPYPVRVRLDNGFSLSFTQDGRANVSDVIPTLRFGCIDTSKPFNYGTPVPTPKLLELDCVTIDCWVTEDRSVFEKGLQCTEAKIVAKHENGYFLDSEGFNWKYAWAKS